MAAAGAAGSGGGALPVDRAYEDMINKFHALSDRICSARAAMQQYVLQTREGATSGVKMSDEFLAFFDDRSHPTYSFCMRFREFMKSMQAYCDTWSESLKATSFNPIEEYLETIGEFTKRIAERKRLMRKLDHYVKRVEHLKQSPEDKDSVFLEQYERKVESTRKKCLDYTEGLRGDLQEFLASRFDFLTVPVEMIFQSVCSHTDMASDNIKKLGSFPALAPPKRQSESSSSEDEVGVAGGGRVGVSLLGPLLQHAGGDVSVARLAHQPAAVESPEPDLGSSPDRPKATRRGSAVFRSPRSQSPLGRSPRRSSSSSDRDELTGQSSGVTRSSPHLEVPGPMGGIGGQEGRSRSERSDSFDFHPLPEVREEEAEAGQASSLPAHPTRWAGVGSYEREALLAPRRAKNSRDRSSSLEEVVHPPGRRRSSSPPGVQPQESGPVGMRRSQTSVGLNVHLETSDFSSRGESSPGSRAVAADAVAPPSDLELIDVLEDPASSKVFKGFCAQEFCQENVLFWLDVKYFQSMTSTPMLMKLVPKIISKYISIGASEQINISDIHRCEIERRIRAASDAANPVPLTPDLFNDAQKEVYTMMCSDMFKRFLNSQLYRDYLSSKAPKALRTRRYSYDWFSKSSPSLDFPKS